MESCKNKQLHITVVEKIKARTGMSPPIGKRIPFVIVADRGLFVDRAEDPDYVRENNIPLDVDYYVKKQILPSVERILGVFGVDMCSLDYDSKQKGLFDFMGKPSGGKFVRNVVKNEGVGKGSGLKKDKPQVLFFIFRSVGNDISLYTQSLTLRDFGKVGNHLRIQRNKSCIRRPSAIQYGIVIAGW